MFVSLLTRFFSIDFFDFNFFDSSFKFLWAIPSGSIIFGFCQAILLQIFSISSNSNGLIFFVLNNSNKHLAVASTSAEAL